MRPFFMMKNTRLLAQGAMLAALYGALGYLQNLLLPGSGHMLIQCRLAEALCIFALFTPAAIYGLGAGCLLLNLAYAPVLPLDPLFGTLATVLGCWCMYGLRRKKWLALWMPVVWNAVLLGLEWSAVLTPGAAALAGLYIGAGEALAIFVPGLLLLRFLTKRRLTRFFSEGGTPCA